MNEPKLDRRPIAARNLLISSRITDVLAKWGMSPNAISVWSMVFGLASGLSFWATSFDPPAIRVFWLLAAFFILMRLLANMFDGMVAVKTGTTSPVGELYNEVPDRVSDTVIIVGAGYALGGSEIVSYLAALAAMLTAYVRAVGKGAGAKQEFCGPLAKQQRMFLLIATAIYLALTPSSWHLKFGANSQYGLLAPILFVIAVGSLITTWRRLVRINANLKKGTK